MIVYYFYYVYYFFMLLLFFFFSSRRRHTRSLRDWSSDVCSSDLLARIATATEPHRSRFELWERMRTLPGEVRPDLYDLLSIAAEAVMEFGTCASVVVPTSRGRTARSVARFRLPVWIAAVTPDEPVARRLHLSYGVHPVPHAAEVTDW